MRAFLRWIISLFRRGEAPPSTQQENPDSSTPPAPAPQVPADPPKQDFGLLWSHEGPQSKAWVRCEIWPMTSNEITSATVMDGEGALFSVTEKGGKNAKANPDAWLRFGSAKVSQLAPPCSLTVTHAKAGTIRFTGIEPKEQGTYRSI